MVSCCKLLGVRSLVLGVQSWSGTDVSVNLHQTGGLVVKNLPPNARASGDMGLIPGSEDPL